MNSPIDNIDFLTRSETRVAILRALKDRPHKRRELATATETPRSTLGRTIAELEDRGWIERDRRTYVITTAGSLIMERLVPLLDTVAALQKLGEMVDLFPLDEIDLDVRDLADAHLVRPTGMDPTAPFDYGIERLSEATRFQCVARTAPPLYVEAIHDGVVTGQFTAECVLDETYLDDLENDHESNERWREIVGSSSTVRRHEEPIPFVLLVLDETVHLWLCDEEGESQGLLESTNPAVVSWANDIVDRYLERSQPIERSQLAGRSS